MANELIPKSGRIFGGGAVMGVTSFLDWKICRARKPGMPNRLFRMSPLLIIGFLIPFSGRLQLARNYRTQLESVFTRLGTFLCVGITLVVSALLVGWLWSGGKNMFDGGFLFLSPVWFVPFLIGLIVGYVQRRRRKLTWEAEDANRGFMEKHGLVERNDQTVYTKTGQTYVVDFIAKDHVRFPCFTGVVGSL